jgi:tetratricopeptide (TPR) repeat protein
MKSRLLSHLLFLCVLSGVTTSYAQVKKLKNVANQFTMSDNPDIELAKFDIDQAAANPESANLAATWGWRGVVYSAIAADHDKYASLDPNNDAAKIAGESFVKFYTYPKDAQEKQDALIYANLYLPNAIVSCYNMGAINANSKGNFATVKLYMGMVDALLVYDTEEKAKAASVSREKALLVTWRSAYMDSLVSEEIVYLEKLISIPTYYNAQNFTRLSEIYTSKKDYEKALSYLEKGKEKIPQKSSEFLDQQINIEIERNNTSSLITKFTEAIEANPDNNAVYYFSRGTVYHNLKKAEAKEQEKAIKNGSKSVASKYYYSMGLADYNKAIELDPGYFDAKFNEAIILNDSADFLYSSRTKLSAAESEKATVAINALYRSLLPKLEWIRESNMVKDAELVELLRLMKSISAKLGDEEKRQRYDKLYKEEKEKLSKSQN